MTTTAHARILLRFDDPATAAAATAAVAPENGTHCDVTREGARVHIEVREARLGSVVATVDDVLACLGAAARVQGSDADPE